MINKKKLEKVGITLIKKFSRLETNRLSAIISNKLCKSFPEYGFKKLDLFSMISKLDMYYANFEDCSAAKYDYKNNSIYFNNSIKLTKLETPAIHECLHFIQTVKTKKGKLKRLGLFEYNTINKVGMIINEASVQLMASFIEKNNYESVKYYDLEFYTTSPNYYPIECSLVSQMAYFTGTYPLFHSTIYSNDIFKNTFIVKSSKSTYLTISKNLNLLVKLQEEIHNEILLLSKIEYKKSIQCQNRIQYLKNEIKNITLKTQELILTTCSYSDLELIKNLNDIKELKNKLYKFQKLIIFSDEYTFFNDFYIKMMKELDKKRELIQKYGTLEVYKEIPEYLSLIETRPKALNLFNIFEKKLKEIFKLHYEKQKQRKIS